MLVANHSELASWTAVNGENIQVAPGNIATPKTALELQKLQAHLAELQASQQFNYQEIAGIEKNLASQCLAYQQLEAEGAEGADAQYEPHAWYEAQADLELWQADCNQWEQHIKQTRTQLTVKKSQLEQATANEFTLIWQEYETLQQNLLRQLLAHQAAQQRMTKARECFDRHQQIKQKKQAAQTRLNAVKSQLDYLQRALAERQAKLKAGAQQMVKIEAAINNYAKTSLADAIQNPKKLGILFYPLEPEAPVQVVPIVAKRVKSAC